MKRDEKLFGHLGGLAAKLLATFVALLAFEVGWADVASAFGEGKALSIHINVSRDNAGNLILPHGEAFEVIITNHSDQPLKIWEEECQPGSRSLTFRVKSGGGDLSIVQKRGKGVSSHF